MLLNYVHIASKIFADVSFVRCKHFNLCVLMPSGVSFISVVPAAPESHYLAFINALVFQQIVSVYIIVRGCVRVCARACVRVRVCVRACVRACACVRVHACVRV